MVVYVKWLEGGDEEGPDDMRLPNKFRFTIYHLIFWLCPLIGQELILWFLSVAPANERCEQLDSRMLQVNVKNEDEHLAYYSS